MIPSLFKRSKNTRKKGNNDKRESDPERSSPSTGRSANFPPHRSSPRLLRSSKLPKNVRHSEEDDSLDGWRFSNNQSMDQSSEVGSGSGWFSRSPSPSNRVPRNHNNIETYLLPPLPLFNKPAVQNGIQPFSQQLPSEPLRPEENREAAEHMSGYLTDSNSSQCSVESAELQDLAGDQELLHNKGYFDGDMYGVSHPNASELSLHSSNQVIRVDGQRGQSNQLPSPISHRVTHKKKNGEGGSDFHIHIHVNNVQDSASNSTFSSPVPSPKASGSSESPWLWNPSSDHPHQGSSSPTTTHDSITNELMLPQMNLRVQNSAILSQHLLSSTPASAHNSILSQTNSSAKTVAVSPSHLPLPIHPLSPQHTVSSGTSYESYTWTNAHPLPHHLTSGTPLSPHTVSIPCSPRASACKWQKGRLLGSGSFGRVYKGIHSETGEFCAIKEVEVVDDDPKERESLKQLEQEIMLLSSLRHPNIVHYKGSEMVDGYLHIYLELVSGGSLYKLFQEFGKFEEPVIRRYTKQILQGLHFLHSMNTVHRDIKGANILVDHDGTIKLADFGMAKHVKEQAVPFSFKGSPYWMAPEVIMQRNTGYAFAVDIWSLGCTVIEMFTGKPPWSEYEGVAAMFKVTRADTPPIPGDVSPDGVSFIRLCLQKDPAKRPSAAALLEHPFVQLSNDGHNLLVNAASALSLSDVAAETSMREENNGRARRFQRRTPHRPSISESPSHAQSQPVAFPSLSAPVSPRASHRPSSGLSPTRSTGFLPGFATPPTGGAGGFPMEYYGATGHFPHRRSANPVDIRQGNQTPLHAARNRDYQPESQLEMRHITSNYRSNGYAASGHGTPPRVSEDHVRRLDGALRRLDEQVSQQLQRRSAQSRMYSG